MPQIRLHTEFYLVKDRDSKNDLWYEEFMKNEQYAINRVTEFLIVKVPFIRVFKFTPNPKGGYLTKEVTKAIVATAKARVARIPLTLKNT